LWLKGGEIIAERKERAGSRVTGRGVAQKKNRKKEKD